MIELRAFTVRLPRDLVDQIDSRAAVSRRSRNAELLVLLESAIDASVTSDLQVIRQTAGQFQNEQPLAE